MGGQPVMLNNRYEILNVGMPTIQTSREELNHSPRSVGSSQSVLSAISPTKDRVLYGR